MNYNESWWSKKGIWSQENAFDEEDARAAYHQRWKNIDSDLDKMGL